MCKTAQLHAMDGDFAVARTMYQQGRVLLDDLGHSVRAAMSSCDIAMIELLAGDAAAAERALRRDFETLVRMGTKYFIASMASILARAVKAQGRDDEALELTAIAEGAAGEDDVEAQVLWRCVRAPIMARRGQADESEALLRVALDRARQT
jgi:ATP/maltotriose-dependent transcriptional regulator MalT